MYPRDFFANVRTQPKVGTCFVVMPFAKRFDAVFRLIKDTLERELHLTCTRADDVLGGGNIMQDVLRGMAESELIVVDVTDRNPNVFYELGIAHMCKPVEKVLLLSQNQASIPFDLRTFRHIVYKATQDGLTTLRDALRQAVEAVQVEVHRLVLDQNARGVLDHEIMGQDHAVYKFEARGGGVGPDWVKVSMRIIRRAIEGSATTMTERVVFNRGLGLKLGEVRTIEGTEWTVTYERIGQNEPCLRIDRVETRARPKNAKEQRGRKAGNRG